MFPAYAGMIRPARDRLHGPGCVPRLRGDDPFVVFAVKPVTLCSPPTRG